MQAVRSFCCLWLVMSGVVLLACGCGGGDVSGPPRATVTGKITLDEKPVEGGEIHFRPSKGAEAVSRIAADGSYKIDVLADGPVVGINRVSIEWYRDTGKRDAEDHMIPEAAIPAKYNSQTTLVIEVTAGKNEHNFTLRSK